MSAMGNTWQGKRPQAIKLVQHTDAPSAPNGTMHGAAQQPGRAVPIQHQPRRLHCIWTKTERGLRCQWVADE